MRAQSDGEHLVLDYNDPLAPRLDPNHIMRRARTRRRLRITTGAAVALMAAAGLTFVAQGQLTAHRLPGAVDPYTIMADQPTYRAHPPTDRPTTVDASLPDWRSLVWYSTDAQFCGGTVGIAGDAVGQVSVQCWQPFTYGPDSPALAIPWFLGLPMPQDNHDQVLGIGVARADVATVRFTFLGAQLHATATPIVVNGKTLFSVYAVWMPLHGATSYSTSEIRNLAAFNKTGSPVT